jgi:hypothetical protein
MHFRLSSPYVLLWCLLMIFRFRTKYKGATVPRKKPLKSWISYMGLNPGVFLEALVYSFHRLNGKLANA